VIVAARRLLYGAGAVQASLCAPCAFQRNITKYLTDEILDVLARPGGAHKAHVPDRLRLLLTASMQLPARRRVAKTCTLSNASLVFPKTLLPGCGGWSAATTTRYTWHRRLRHSRFRFGVHTRAVP